MNGTEAMYKEDAEKLARQIQDDDPMVEIREIRLDPEIGGYVILIYDGNTDEEYLVDHYEAWVEKQEQINQEHLPEMLVEKVYERKGAKVAKLRGEWVEVPEERWPDRICDAVEGGRIPGEWLPNVEPALLEYDAIEPGHQDPREYGMETSYLVLLQGVSAKVWRKVTKLANFTLADQTSLVQEWRALGFDIAPEPDGPYLEPGMGDWNENEVLEEVKDRLLDISEKGFEAILVDGVTSVSAYAWVLAGVMGLKVVTSWSAGSDSGEAGYESLGYSELLHFRTVEESI